MSGFLARVIDDGAEPVEIVAKPYSARKRDVGVERRFDPGQLRDDHGRWMDGPGGAASYALDAFENLYSAIVDDASAGDWEVSLHENGDFVLSLLDEDGRRTPVLDGLDPDKARSIADDLEWATSEEIPADADNDPATRLLDWRYGEDDIVIGYDHSGDVSLRVPKGDDANATKPDEFDVYDMSAEDAADLAEVLRDMADSREELDDEEAGRSQRPASGRTVEELRQILVRKFNPNQLRDPGGENGGQWIKVGSAGDAVKDALKLADRIQLGPGERFRGSASVDDGIGDLTAVVARIDSPTGRRLRFGTVRPEDTRRWQAGNKGATVELDEAGAAELRRVVADGANKGRQSVSDFRAELRRLRAEGVPEADWPHPEADIDSGVIKGANWGDIHWNLTREEGDYYLDYGVGGEWNLALEIVAPAAGDERLDSFNIDTAARAKKLAAALDRLGFGESDTTEVSRRYASDGGGTRTGQETTGPKGGQFALGGGRVGAKGKAKPASKRPARKTAAPAKPAGPLGYDGKTGAGYGIKGGDARVRTLQSVLNRFGLKDSSGQPLAVDGKFGPRTTAAVKKLQKAMGMEPDGKVTEDFIKRVANAKSLDELRPPKPPAKPRAPRRRVRRSATAHEMDNGICRTCQPPDHVLVNGICQTCD